MYTLTYHTVSRIIFYAREKYLSHRNIFLWTHIMQETLLYIIMYGGREVQNSFERKKSFPSTKKVFRAQKKI